MSGAEKNLVLGTAYGYRIEQVRLFAESLRGNYHGHAPLLVTRWARWPGPCVSGAKLASLG
jgi:hypothetical protein